MSIECFRLTSLDLSNFDTSKVTDMHDIFSGCSKLSEVALGASWHFVGDLSALPTPPTTSPYTGCWQLSSGGTAYTPSDLVQAYDGSTMAGTYVWQKVALAYITYKGNGADGGFTPATEGVVGEVTHTANNGFTRTGYTFICWTTHTATLYREGSPLTMPKDGVVLYALWVPNLATLHFDANGGTGQMSDQQLTYDESSTLPANAFTKEGCTFENWNTEADGSGTSYTDAQEVLNLTADPDVTITLYAQWKEDAS